MNNVYLISCVAVKQPVPAPAKDLYISPLFRKARAYIEKHAEAGNRWYILSALHGLVEPDRVLAPYNTTLNTMGRAERSQWVNKVYNSLLKVTDPGRDILVFLAGQHYREPLAALLAARGYQVEVPMQGLTIGRQLQWLSGQQ